MNFFYLGIDHKVASIDIREAIYWKREAISKFLARYDQTAVFATCNRFEIYGIGKDEFSSGVLTDIFRDKFKPLFDNAYVAYNKKSVLRHVVRLASGLESQIKGELQIYGQVASWAEKRDFPDGLAPLVHDALLAAHDIRMKNGFNKPENNIAVVTYRKILSEIKPHKFINIVVAGTGKIAQLFALYKPHDVRIKFAAHKNISRAEDLAKKAEGEFTFLEELPKELLTADVLVSATSSPHRIFDRDFFLNIAAKRGSELHVYDLALPRDIEPDVKEISGIILKNIDDFIIARREVTKQSGNEIVSPLLGSQ